MRRGIVATLAVALLLPACGQDDPVQPVRPAFGQGTPYTQYEVVLPSSPVTWEQARNAAAVDGGYLATIADAGENAVVKDRIATAGFTGMHCWIGWYQKGGQEPYGGWKWVTGQKVTFVNWGIQLMPPYTGIGNDVGAMSVLDGHWADLPNDFALGCYVREYETGLIIPDPPKPPKPPK